MLEVKDIHTYYDDSYILQGINLKVNPGEIVCLLGRNGAGKTTTMKSIMGYNHPRKGTILFRGQNISRQAVFKNVRMGLGYVPEDRRIFSELTVQENFEISFNSATEIRWTIDDLFGTFPLLDKFRHRKGGELSGGEQQMVAIVRALACQPKMLLLDEPCEGLAPVIVGQLSDIIIGLKEHFPILLAEQNAHFALEISDRGYIIDKGLIRFSGTRQELQENKENKKRYLSV
ncbi:MAG: ABC transporter ATP-binding protein [Deltaproteobacteria bacterium]|nr:MAG: ABC transporter ATP-binding protein [Deltaproteobacteria bacterium]